MKKSRIIIPALAMIAFSVAASVTGAVAWFTAQRTATVNAGTYAVVKTTSDLSVTAASGIGTAADNSGATKAITVNGKLTDGSFDHIGQKIYTPNAQGTSVMAGDKGEVALSAATADNMKRGSDGTNNIYTAITFDLTFKIKFSDGANGNIALFLDNTEGKTQFTTSGAASTAKGFRMAFIPQGENAGDANARVLADLQTSTNCKHVNSDTKATLGGNAYSSPYLMDSAYVDALPDVPQALTAYASRPDYLGVFQFSKKDTNNEVALTYKVVCWYEGTDPEITNNATDFQSVTAQLCFEAKDVAAA